MSLSVAGKYPLWIVSVSCSSRLDPLVRSGVDSAIGGLKDSVYLI